MDNLTEEDVAKELEESMEYEDYLEDMLLASGEGDEE